MDQLRAAAAGNDGALVSEVRNMANRIAALPAAIALATRDAVLLAAK